MTTDKTKMNLKVGTAWLFTVFISNTVVIDVYLVLLFTRY